MNKKIIFIADFFSDQIAGGGELNNDEVIQLFRQKGYIVEKINSRNCDINFLFANKNNFFIIANFVEMHKSCFQFLEKYCKYIIYEHDHKYLKTRNPADYTDYKAPEEGVVNKTFYINAKAVLLQSSFHKNIILKNIPNINAVNLSGNLWSLESLELLEKLSEKEKNDKCSIMDTNNWHKNTNGAVLFCKQKNLEYELISNSAYADFLQKISKNKKLVFLPKTTETLSRIVVECRMMNMSVITNEKIGASYEDWFKLKGKDLIQEMKKRRETIPNIIEEYIK